MMGFDWIFECRWQFRRHDRAATHARRDTITCQPCRNSDRTPFFLVRIFRRGSFIVCAHIKQHLSCRTILGKRPNVAAGAGAVIIIGASLLSALPSVLSPDEDDVKPYWYGIL